MRTRRAWARTGIGFHVVDFRPGNVVPAQAGTLAFPGLRDPRLRGGDVNSTIQGVGFRLRAWEALRIQGLAGRGRESGCVRMHEER